MAVRRTIGGIASAVGSRITRLLTICSSMLRGSPLERDFGRSGSGVSPATKRGRKKPVLLIFVQAN